MFDPVTVARFWSKVDVKDNESECWPWLGALRGGYGNVKIGGRNHSANRIAWEMTNETKLGALLACHHCDNKMCCNPSHIYAGTAEDNLRDVRLRSGRKADVLNEKKVDRIRARLHRGDTRADIAKDYGVVKSTIAKIATGKSWACVPHKKLPMPPRVREAIRGWYRDGMRVCDISRGLAIPYSTVRSIVKDVRDEQKEGRAS